MGRIMNSENPDRVTRVIKHILSSYPDRAGDITHTLEAIQNAMASLGSFVIPPTDRRQINQTLAVNQASILACQAAWALYKDYTINEDRFV